jgi:hypothetical protein
MLPKNITVNGTCYKIPGPNTSVFAIKEVVTCGPIVHGNMHDPNVWYYDAKWMQMWYGGEFRYYYPRIDSLYAINSGYFGLCDDPDGPLWDRASVKAIALSKLFSKVRGELDLGVDIAEWKQTRTMLADLKSDAAKGVGSRDEYERKVKRSIRDLKREIQQRKRQSGLKSMRFVRTPSKVLQLLLRIPALVKRDSRSLANGVLQYKYGWKPLLADYYGAVNEEIRTVVNRLKQVRASHRIPITEDTIQHRRINNMSAAGVIRKGTGKQTCMFSVHMDCPTFDWARWSTLNPIGLAWELIPYSFVVDWFYDVGSYLRDLETALLYRSQFVSGYCSELYQYFGTEKVMPGQVWPIGGNQWWKQSGITTAWYRRSIFSRTLLTSWPLPNAPSFEAHLGGERLLVAAALLRQLILRN